MPSTTHTGSCHCGAVRFTATVDLSAGTNKCNCTWCWKHRWWSIKAATGAFELEAGAEQLTEGAKGGFCTRCGVYVFQIVETAGWGEGFPPTLASINVICLDGIEPAALIEAPVQYFDGLHDNWWSPPAEVRHL